MNKKIILFLLIVLFFVIGYFFLLRKSPNKSIEGFEDNSPFEFEFGSSSNVSNDLCGFDEICVNRGKIFYKTYFGTQTCFQDTIQVESGFTLVNPKRNGNYYQVKLVENSVGDLFLKVKNLPNETPTSTTPTSTTPTPTTIWRNYNEE